MSSECEAHVDLIHFAVANLPIVVATAIGNAKTASGREFGCDAHLLPFTSNPVHEPCETPAWASVAYPGLNEWNETEMFVTTLCHPHFALLVLMADEWTQVVER